MINICDVVLDCLTCSEVTGPGAIEKAAIVNNTDCCHSTEYFVDK